MTALKPGDTFPEDVKFSYIPYTPEIDAVTSCGIPQPYDASKGKRARSSSPLIMVLPCLLPSSSSITNGKKKAECVTNSPTTSHRRVQGEEDSPRGGARRLHADVPEPARHGLHQAAARAEEEGRRPGCRRGVQRRLRHVGLGQGERRQG